MDKIRPTLGAEKLGQLAYWLARGIGRTLRWECQINSAYQFDRPYLFSFWHGKQFLPILWLQRHQTPCTVLVSPSKDGDLLSAWLSRVGYQILRGSSRDSNVRALRAMMRSLEGGASMGFGVDGPIGPPHRVKPGMTYLSRRLGIPIVPVGSASRSKWIFEDAWDRYELPKPFSKVCFCIGAPWQVGPTDDLEEANEVLNGKIRAVESMAEEMASA